MICDMMFRTKKDDRWVVGASNFDEFKNNVRRVLRENRDTIHRNFPNVVYKQLVTLSDGTLPANPSAIYAEEWKGWRDLLGPDYFSNDKHPCKNNTPEDDKPEILPGVEESNRFDVEWNQKFVELQKYYHKHGSLIVTKEHKSLQMWSGTQRSLHKRGMLRKDRKAALDRIYFDWEPQQNEWDGYFKLLTSFKELHGHVDVPSRYKPNYRLGQWVREQRIFYRDGVLRKSRVQRLEAIGFRWKIPESERCLTLEQRGNDDGKK